jgi:hypothetical protein
MRKVFKRLTERLEELERELTSILQLSQSTT